MAEDKSNGAATASQSSSSTPTSNAAHAKRLGLITAVIGLPYLGYLAYLYVHLQSGWLRAPVAVNDTRQLLIVGTQSSGTTDIGERLNAMGAEIGHETSDATWTFARDGTISWLHALRFMPGHAQEVSLRLFCSSSRRNMGFHPAMFRVPRRGCSYRSEWDGCWQAECVDIVSNEWGCSGGGGGDDGDASCETPFRRALLQVRHPLRVVESLVVKFCTALDAPPHQYAIAMLTALWPHHDWAGLSCASTFGWYWTLYNEAMLDAPGVDEWYKVEQTDPCKIAEAGGLLERGTSVDAGTHERVLASCTKQQREKPPEQARANQRNQGKVRLSVGDVCSGADGLEERMRALAQRLGYEL